RANILRRRSAQEQAASELERAIALAQELPAPVDLALCWTQLGYVFSKRPPRPGSYLEAESAFSQAIEHFRALELPFWEAHSRSGLASLHIAAGRLPQAAEELAYCRKVYQTYEVDGPLAGVLIDSGW